MFKKILVLSVLIISTLGHTANADTNQVNVLGLIPNVSTSADIKTVAFKNYGDDMAILKISEHKFTCFSEFSGKVLDQLLCALKDKYTSNEINSAYNNLIKAFTSDLGTPTKIKNYEKENKYGVLYQVGETYWVDKIGNVLMISYLNYTSGGNSRDISITLLSPNSVKNYKDLQQTLDLK